MTRVDVYWTEPHFGDHIIPTFEKLPPERRGHVLNPPPGMEPPPGENLLLVASWGDFKRARAAGRRVIFSEHGCGQFFRHPDGRLLLHSSYAGAARPGAVLILVPNEVTASAYEESGLNPGVPVAVVGCPKLDPWIDTPAEPNEERTVAISFHWDCKVVPETGSAWREYFSPPDALAELAEEYHVLGHGHPRIFSRLAPRYEALGIEPVEKFSEVLRRAEAYAVDGSSTLYEFAATGRPVVVINSRHYRRGVRHGLRFWDAAHVGFQCDSPEQLVPAMRKALADPPFMRRCREDALRMVYTHLDGSSARRAADAIVRRLEELDGSDH